MTFDEWWATYDPDGVNTSADRNFAAMVWAEAEAAAVERERERCATLVEDSHIVFDFKLTELDKIAARIREGTT